MTLTNFRPHHSYRSGLHDALLFILDMLAAVATAFVLIVLVRVEQFGPSFLFLLALLVTTCVVPFFVLRKTEQLKLRAALMLTGNLVGVGFMATTLGVVTTSLICLPFFFALGAAVFDQRIIKLVFALTALGLVAIAGAFLTGTLHAPELSLRNWNASIANWIVTLFTVLSFSKLMVLLIHSLKRSWQDTDTESIEKFSQMEALFEYAPEAIVILDADLGCFVAANSKAEQLFGVSREALTKRSVFTIISPEYQPGGQLSEERARALVDRALNGEHPTFQWRHLNANGDEIPCEISLSRLPPFNKKLVRAAILDISQRLKEQAKREDLQSQLAEAQRMEAIGRLTGGVAHDFNNLLAIVLGNLELLRERSQDPDHLRLLEPSIKATLRGADLTNNMLSFARRAPLSPSCVDLNTLVQETQSWTGRTLPTNINLRTSFEQDLWPVRVDASAVESALINLILNARDAMGNGGSLSLQTVNKDVLIARQDSLGNQLNPGRYAVISVEDSGTGMSASTLERSFEPFFTTKDTGRGSGLGLPMVQGFMQQSGGVIQVQSEPSQGTKIELYFPVSNEQAHPAPERVELEAVNKTHPRRILLVEDQADVRRVVVEMLNTDGHKVVSCQTADEARGHFETDRQFDLLLTDIVMPGKLQGTTLASALRDLSPDLPVILMSGYASDALQADDIRPGDIRLTKPVQRADLRAAIDHATQDRRPRLNSAKSAPA